MRGLMSATDAKGICVVGSINQDLVASVPHIPMPGETLLGTGFAGFSGGKGANQAYAAAKLGARTAMIGAVGDDAYGSALIANLSSVGVDVSGVRQEEGSSGLALIAHAPGGENSIVVIPGANGKVSPAQLDTQMSQIRRAGMVLAQLEIPMETIEHLAQMTMVAGVSFMLDPAPAQRLSEDLMRAITWLTPNETEQRILLDVDRTEPEKAARRLLETGVRNVALKLGARGIYLAGADCKTGYVPGFAVEAVDTTAAGDVFNAAFAVALGRGMTAVEAARFGTAAAAISVTRRGAQSSAPTLAEVESLLRE